MGNEALGTLGSFLCIKINASADFLFRVMLMYYIFSLEALMFILLALADCFSLIDLYYDHCN